MKPFYRFAVTLLAFALAAGALACERDEGPLEDAGEEVDEAVDEAEDELEN